MMSTSPRFYSPTMARLYAGQGYLRKAAQIYRYLLHREPGREDLERELAVIEDKMERQSHPARKELGLLLREWTELIEKQKELKRKGCRQKGGDDENQNNEVED